MFLIVRCEFSAAGAPAQVMAPIFPNNNNQIQQTQLELAWNAPNDNGSAITGYEIIFDLENEGEKLLVANTGNNNTTYPVTGLGPGETYRFKVSAIKAV